MYAKNLSEYLHRKLADDPRTYPDTRLRFEQLRASGHLPRGRERAGERLTDEQIALAILGFADNKPGWAGHAATVMRDLKPVGGVKASFNGAANLVSAIACAIGDYELSSKIVSCTLSISSHDGGEEYQARILFEENEERHLACYVTKYAISLLTEGAEQSYDPETLQGSFEKQLVLGNDFFRSLSRNVDISRHLNKPLKTDFSEYQTEEEKKDFYKKLGVNNGSRFLHFGVDTTVTWPSEATRMEFGGCNFILFPKTKENSQSISIDLGNERIKVEEAITLLNRFLSVLSWCDNRHAILREGRGGNPVPIPVPRRNISGGTMHEWLFFRSMPTDEDLLKSLSYYREGLNSAEAGIVCFEVLSFYKVFEVKYTSKAKAQEWISDVFQKVQGDIRPKVLDIFNEDCGAKNAAEYLYEQGRVASAHASNRFPSDSDTSQENVRLYIVGKVMKALARYYIKTEYNLSDSYLSDDLEKF